jgi:WD40 repeat protein
MADRPSANPYPGPRPFVAGERLYGRDGEVTRLFYLLSAERIVVLHSPSGAGKSSLLNAGLVPRLRGERFYPWPAIRLSQPSANGGNRFVGSVVASLEEGLPGRLRRPAEELAGVTLAEYVGARPRRPGAPVSVVLVFDQFEEILTVDPLDLEAKREFFRQLGEVLKDPEVWALFALREDYLGALDPYRDGLPTRLSNTFRVDLLTVDDAVEAIARPARDAGREFAPEAALQLARDLATVSVQQPDGSFTEEAGVYVEPLQLQVVCRRLWDELSPEARTIGVENLLAAGDVDSALAAYYDGSVAEVARGDVPAERGVREWFSERLITQGGIRGQVLREQSASGGLDNDSVDRLVTTHLVRAEQRDGKTWLELAHDRLVAPVRESNAAWLEQRLHPMQRQAALWEREGRPESLLLRGQELKDAEAWAQHNPTFVRPIESDLLSLSVKRREAERRRRRTLTAIGVGLLVLVALFAALGVWALVQRGNAISATTSAHTQLMSSVADQHLANTLDVSLLLSLANYERNPRSVQARSSMIAALTEAQSSGVRAILRTDQGNTKAVAFSPAGDMLAAGGSSGTVTLWNVQGNGQVGAPVILEPPPDARDQGVIDSVAFGPDGTTVAGGTAQGDVFLWSTQTHRPVRTLNKGINGGASTSLAFNGTMLAAGAGFGGVHFWKGRSYAPDDEIYRSPDNVALLGGGPVASIAFSSDGSSLAAATGSGTRVWNLRAPGKREMPAKAGADVAASSVAFRPKSPMLAIGDPNGRVVLWDTERHRQLGAPLTGPQGRVTSLAFSPNGGTLAAGTIDGTVLLWKVSNRRQIGRLTGYEGSIWSVAFGRRGHTLVAGTSAGPVLLWGVPTHASSITTLGTPDPHEGARAAFNPGGLMLAESMVDATTGVGRLLFRKVSSSYRPAKSPVGASRVGAFAFNRKGSALAAAVPNTDVLQGRLLLWRLRRERPIGRPRQLELTPGDGGSCGQCPLYGVAFSPDGRTVAATYDGGDLYGSVLRWNVSDGRRVGPPLYYPQVGSSHRMYDVAFSPDGDALVAVSDGKVVVWGLVNGKASVGMALPGVPYTTSVAFAKDGTLAVGTDDRTVVLVDLRKQGSIVRTLRAASPITDVAFSPDGRSVAASTAGGTVLVWDVSSGVQTGALDFSADGAGESVSFSRDGHTLAVGMNDGTVKIWSIPGVSDLAELEREVCGLVHGNLGSEEWSQLVPGITYRTICRS